MSVARVEVACSFFVKLASYRLLTVLIVKKFLYFQVSKSVLFQGQSTCFI